MIKWSVAWIASAISASLLPECVESAIRIQSEGISGLGWTENVIDYPQCPSVCVKRYHQRPIAVEAISQMNHANVRRPICIDGEGKYSIVGSSSPLISFSDLKIGKSSLRNLASEMFAALVHVHSKGFLHLNVQAESIHYHSTDGGIKFALSNFDSAVKTKSIKDLKITVDMNTAPEIVKCLEEKNCDETNVTEAADWYSLGVTLCYLALKPEDRKHIASFIARKYPSYIKTEFADLLDVLLNPDPAERKLIDIPQLYRITKMTYFRQVHWNTLLDLSIYKRILIYESSTVKSTISLADQTEEESVESIAMSKLDVMPRARSKEKKKSLFACCFSVDTCSQGFRTRVKECKNSRSLVPLKRAYSVDLLDLEDYAQTKVVVKRANASYKNLEKHRGFLRKEIAILDSLDHRNIIKPLCQSRMGRSKNLTLFLPFYENGDATDWIGGKATKDELKKLIVDMVNAITYLHEKGIVHCDIKPDNILRNNQGSFVLIDFSFSRRLDDEKSLTEIVGTPIYSAPEIYSCAHKKTSLRPLNEDFPCGKILSPAADWYSFGMTIAEMAPTSKPLKSIRKPEKFDFSGFDEEVAQLLKLLLNPDASKRNFIGSDLKVLFALSIFKNAHLTTVTTEAKVNHKQNLDDLVSGNSKNDSFDGTRLLLNFLPSEFDQYLQFLRTITAILVSSLIHLHSDGYLHFNIHPSNVLFSIKMRSVLLTNLSHRKIIGSIVPPLLSNSITASPEYLKCMNDISKCDFSSLNEAHDWYGLGATLFYWICEERETEFPKYAGVHVVYLSKYEHRMHSYLLSFLRLLLSQSPKNRRFATEKEIVVLLRHPFLSTIEWSEYNLPKAIWKALDSKKSI